jgi:hypothetical protein
MKNRSDTWYLVSAGILFGLFLLNIFLGKAALFFDKEPILELGDVGEFAILLAAVICFVIVVLRLELQESNGKTESANNAKEDI